MSDIDFMETRRIFEAHRSHYRSVEIKLQPASVEELKVKDTDLPVYHNILVTEARQLVQIAKPYSILIENADSENATYWWNNLKDSFTNDLKNISFLMINLGDNWKPKLDGVNDILHEVVEKMIVINPDLFYVYASEKSFTFSTMLKQERSGRQTNFSFSFEILGKWNLRTSYGPLFSDLLKSHLPNMKKLYLVFNFPCSTCTQRIFEKINWPFSIEHLDPKVFWNTQESNRTPYRFAQYAGRMTLYNNFEIEANGTKIILLLTEYVNYFFGDMKSVEWSKQKHPNPMHQVSC